MPIARSLAAITAALALGVGLVVGAPGAHDSAEAANAADFDAGYIISDANFYDDDAMTQAEIQAFLEANTGTCRNSNCLPVLRVDTFDRAANNPCKAYRGAPGESAAAVIFKVQQACNISAKVILVTLHKEQGLIGKTAPTDLELRKAMGYGCPDTASCDSRYYGFYNQVYNAAWQFGWYRIGYSTPGSSFYGKYPLGQISQILYHPYNNCGTSGVRVQNFATAALYHYTPYQPNAAALANLYGVGDTCSSYGNRNFWRMYTDWFGSPVAVDGTDAVAKAFADAGGPGGVLGAVTVPENCDLGDSTCFQRHVNGTIYWTVESGAWPVVGDYVSIYEAAGGVSGPMGPPIAAAVTVASTPNGPGAGQQFKYGTIYSSAAGAYAVWGGIRTKWWSLNGNQGELGWPTSSRACLGAHCWQNFQAGIAFESQAVVKGGYLSLYSSLGGPRGSLGPATSDYVDVPDSGNGVGGGQQFVNGTVYSSAAGTYPVLEPVRTHYWRAGSNQGVFGWPTAAQQCVNGRCWQPFAGGIVVSDGITLNKAYSDVFIATGSASGTLGMPTSAFVEVPSTPNGPGSGQQFERGTIYSSAAGTFPVWGVVRAEWWRTGGNMGALGWPVANPVCSGGVCSQEFQNGVVVQTSATTAVVTLRVHSSYSATHSAFKAELGMPTSAFVEVPSTPNGPGSGQQFERGTIYSSAAGTFPVWGVVRAEWWRTGGNMGGLGWPVANPVCSGGVCSQEFQNGVVTQTSATTAVVAPPVHPDYAATYAAHSAELGAATSAFVRVETPNGPGGGQQFQRGTIYSSAAGTYAVWGEVRSYWWSAGGNMGSFGWPTADPSCSGGLCTQSFQGGTITR
ncbi:hypothetical protein [Ruicaihuangia caeni]|uniref:LGFP repeat-containing protein n=1 Tax=Ruicaihuangia caeni TaxID=3042517 RepID=A0AAW6TCW0_9MICO|nr:hypothetical protein [Klugiella sp. YN-L-19]MDI2099417.1 hypothetical protein [Klugiella sp. YN-L-19]